MSKRKRGRLYVSGLAVVTAAALAVLIAPGLATGRPAHAGASLKSGWANQGIPGASTTNPLAGSNLMWGYDTQLSRSTNLAYYDYTYAPSKELADEFASVALRPTAEWFGSFNTGSKAYTTAADAKTASAADDAAVTKDVDATISSYVKSVQASNPQSTSSTGSPADTLVSLAAFALGPFEDQLCTQSAPPSQKAAYTAWIDGMSEALTNVRSAVIMQPDLPVVDGKCAKQRGFTSKYEGEVRQAAEYLHSHDPYTTVYLDAGSSDWLSASSAAQLLINSGVRYTRGFSLDGTHFASTSSQITYGRKIVLDLNAYGKAHHSASDEGKHFIIDTSENGHPFTKQAATKAGVTTATGTEGSWAKRPACLNKNGARAGAGANQRYCESFGIPPTADTSAAQWGLAATVNADAAKYVDGYVWFGRPWLFGQSTPFCPALVAGMDISSPYPYAGLNKVQGKALSLASRGQVVTKANGVDSCYTTWWPTTPGSNGQALPDPDVTGTIPKIGS